MDNTQRDMSNDIAVHCPKCGSMNLHYEGIDDGGGVYGSSVCDQWYCNDCDTQFEAGCIESDPE